MNIDGINPVCNLFMEVNNSYMNLYGHDVRNRTIKEEEEHASLYCFIVLKILSETTSDLEITI